MPEEIPLATHKIAVGNTRPALVPVFNIPLKDVTVWGILAMEAAVYRIQFLAPIAAGFLYACTLYRKDYNAGRCFVSWLMTSAGDLAARSLGGTSIPAEPGRRAFRGIAHGRADA
jgi:type IV secretory pathway VirB3-like protein